MMLADRRLGPLIAPDTSVSLEQWLEAYVGKDRAADGPIAVLDLSLVSSDVVHIAVAVIARLVFEAIQRHRRLNEDELPTVLVLEEAHSFVRRSRRDEENTVSPTTLCRQTFRANCERRAEIRSRTCSVFPATRRAFADRPRTMQYVHTAPHCKRSRPTACRQARSRQSWKPTRRTTQSSLPTGCYPRLGGPGPSTRGDYRASQTPLPKVERSEVLGHLDWRSREQHGLGVCGSRLDHRSKTRDATTN